MPLPRITGSLSPNSLPSALSDEQWHALWEQWRYWLDCVAAQRFIPSLDQENGRQVTGQAGAGPEKSTKTHI